ncbi:MAG TPA: tRNA 2-thiouridine(34) synthase MnmA [Treponemataceae bacterium]|nr:tRNA 2-thiouridine(34) synthase MnmA [Treponemataceae bacterium]
MAKILVGMSGGVDSSVAAKLLLDQGHEVAGVTLKLYSNEDLGEPEKQGRTCCSLDDIQDARRVAYKLGIEHFVFNFQELFAEKVIDKFVDTYLEGATPNPCIDCNRFIKFDKLVERAILLGYDYVATGHYARIEKNPETGRLDLLRGADLSKDQSYVLYCLTQNQLAHTLFPLGGMTKAEIRLIAEDAGLVNARKPDSQDICFVPDGDYAGFIERRSPGKTKSGDFIDAQGNKIGTHRGITHYTIGQRRGIATAFGKPMYVAAKDAKNNTVTLGENHELSTPELVARDLNLIAVEKIDSPMRVTAKIRYNQKDQGALLLPGADNSVIVRFDEPQRAVAPGQAVVFYQGERVIGGGTI